MGEQSGTPPFLRQVAWPMRGTVWPSSRALSTSCSDHSSWATFGKCHTGDFWVIYLLWCFQYPIITNQRPSLLLPRVERRVFGIKRTREHNYDSNRPNGYPIQPQGSGRVSRVGLKKSERPYAPWCSWVASEMTPPGFAADAMQEFLTRIIPGITEPKQAHIYECLRGGWLWFHIFNFS